MSLVAVGLVILIMLAQPSVASAAEIKILCSNGIKAVMEELAPQFERATKHKVVISYGLSAALKRQIEAGEPFDIAILTPPLIDDLVKQGKIAGDTRTVLARSGMALAIRAGAPKPDIRTTDALKRTLLESKSIAYAKEGASGVFFVELVQRLGLTDGLKSKITLTTTGAEVGASVARGDAQLGVLPVSEILPVHGVEVLGTFPADVQGYVVMVAGVSPKTTQSVAAKELIEFLTAPAALPVIKKKGMERWTQNPPTAVQSAIPGVIAAGARVEQVRGGFQGLEGPVAIPDAGLYFSDITANRTYKLNASGTISVWRENTKGANGLFLLKDGRLLGAEGGGARIVAVTPDGHVTSLAAAFDGKPLRSPNDLIPDKKDGIYFTDPAPRPAPNLAPKERGNVHYLRPNGEVLLLDDQIARPNGITLSLDEKTLLVDDTEGEYVYAFDVQPDGRVKNKRPFVRLREPEQGPQGMRSRADGMALDSKDRLYVATASGVQMIDPHGQYLGTIRVPSVVRNLAFAGPSRQTLYMTALESLYRVQMLSQGPAGRAK